jgi:hypothetical protein
MRENFVISFDRSHNFNSLWKIIICLIITTLIIGLSTGLNLAKFGSISIILSFILLFMIIYVIISSITNENLSNELPSTLYPSLPHTGLDGISLNNYMAGMDMTNYQVIT